MNRKDIFHYVKFGLRECLLEPLRDGKSMGVCVWISSRYVFNLILLLLENEKKIK